MISYLQAIDVIRTFALNHYFINKFDFEFREQMPNLATIDEAYPLLFVVPIASDTIQNVNEFDIDVYCVDRYQKDRTNVNYVVSDCNQTLNDLVLWLEEGQDDIEIVSTSTQTPINNDLLDYVGGWVLRLRLQVEKIGLCEIPFKGGQPTPPSCPSGFIRNSNGSFTEIVPSGDTVTLDDVRIRVYDQDENFLAGDDYPSNIPVDITIELPPAEVNAEAINSLDEIVTTALLTPTNNQILAPDGIVHIKKEDDGTIANVSTPSGNTTIYKIQNNDITVNLANPFSIHAEDPLDIRLHKVNGNDITPNSVTYQGNQNRVTIVAPNSVITLKDSANTTISTTNVQATESANITAPDGAITVNGSSVGIVKSNGTRALFVKLNGTNSGTYDGTDTINITTTPRGAEQLKTFQTTSYSTGDDGNLQQGRGTSHLLLGWTNKFGNNNRFTDTLGGATYANNIVLDHQQDNGTSIMGYFRSSLLLSNDSYANNISYCNALNTGGFSGWRMTNVRQLEVLMNYELTNILDFAPFNSGGAQVHSSTTYKPSTTLCHALNGSYMSVLGKGASTAKCLPCRRFTYAELGL